MRLSNGVKIIFSSFSGNIYKLINDQPLIRDSRQLAKEKSSEIQSEIEKERLKLKNAEFCTCLYKSLPLKDSVFVNEGSGAAYLELGAHGIEAYNKVMDVATQRAKTKYKSKYDRNLSIMKCLDFYNSKELEDLVKSLDSELNMDELKK